MINCVCLKSIMRSTMEEHSVQDEAIDDENHNYLVHGFQKLARSCERDKYNVTDFVVIFA